ncbi:hypothetical protein M0811_09215 [Anaeramoeba ignava]|uniref:Alpha N-terminal protein methyltransferase 1 n=1 Tax=Anaeramoeba ignava TaxID=1746090 RepID=A0A9Q0RAG3_ANAIG|nr:hypothetical protein M0811_09215 [Anaeramoeba ignava]
MPPRTHKNKLRKKKKIKLKRKKQKIQKQKQKIQQQKLQKIQKIIKGKNMSGNKIENYEKLFTSKDDWYAKSKQFWKESEPTVNGMLGGYEEISEEDTQHSIQFLSQFLDRFSQSKTKYALDCGSGIGRVTKNVFLPSFDAVDLVDSENSFLEVAKQNLDPKKVLNFYCSPLEKFTPDPNKYDLIWVQWVAIYFADDDFVIFLKNCKQALKENGIIIIKDNSSKNNGFVLDESDNSIIRSIPHYKSIFKEANLEILKEETILFTGASLYPVTTFALK